MQGFEAIVDTKDDYPIRSRENTLIRPGHMVFNDIYIFIRHNLMKLSWKQNKVSLAATKVTSDPNIQTIDPKRRNCLFSHEHAPNHPLKAHQKYSQVWRGTESFNHSQTN